MIEVVPLLVWAFDGDRFVRLSSPTITFCPVASELGRHP